MCSPRLEKCKESQKDHVMIGAFFLRCAAMPAKKVLSSTAPDVSCFWDQESGEETKIEKQTYRKISLPQPQWSNGQSVRPKSERSRIWVFVIDLACGYTENSFFRIQTRCVSSFALFCFRFGFVSALRCSRLASL